MGVYLSVARIKVDESKILGKVESLGLYDVYEDDGVEVEGISLKDGLPAFNVMAGEDWLKEGYVFLEPMEKFFLAPMVCYVSGRGYISTPEGKLRHPLMKAEIAYKAINKIMPFMDAFIEAGFLGIDETKGERFLLDLHKLLKKAVEENNLVLSTMG